MKNTKLSQECWRQNNEKIAEIRREKKYKDKLKEQKEFEEFDISEFNLAAISKIVNDLPYLASSIHDDELYIRRGKFFSRLKVTFNLTYQLLLILYRQTGHKRRKRSDALPLENMINLTPEQSKIVSDLQTNKILPSDETLSSSSDHRIAYQIWKYRSKLLLTEKPETQESPQISRFKHK